MTEDDDGDTDGDGNDGNGNGDGADEAAMTMATRITKWIRNSCICWAFLEVPSDVNLCGEPFHGHCEEDGATARPRRSCDVGDHCATQSQEHMVLKHTYTNAGQEHHRLHGVAEELPVVSSDEHLQVQDMVSLTRYKTRILIKCAKAEREVRNSSGNPNTRTEWRVL